jgi:tripartite-type tricarboxylate transporter receptor subunit TctC
MTMLKALTAVGFGAILSLAAAGQGANAQTAAEFYAGKRIEIYTGGAPGSSYDTWARVYGDYLTKHLPGNPTFLVRNMPGGGHITVTNYLLEKAPQDGTALGLFSQFIPQASVTGVKKDQLKADPNNFFHFLGSGDDADQVCFVRSTHPAQNAADMFKHELIFGGSGAGSGTTGLAVFFQKIIGMKIKLIDGYKNSDEIMLAMERGEVHGLCQTYQGLQKRRLTWPDPNYVRILVRLREREIPGVNVSSAYEFVKEKHQREALDFYANALSLGRPFVAPPAVPKDRVELLRKAFHSMIQDKAFIDTASKQNLDFSPIEGADMEKVFAKVRSSSREAIDTVLEFMGE